jgi:hypothetical protein
VLKTVAPVETLAPVGQAHRFMQTRLRQLLTVVAQELSQFLFAA